jgi:hypothetical protein
MNTQLVDSIVQMIHVPGCLENPSINHDRYLYSQP